MKDKLNLKVDLSSHEDSPGEFVLQGLFFQ